MASRKLDDVLSVRVTKEMKEALRKMAEDQERRLGDILRKVLAELLDK